MAPEVAHRKPYGAASDVYGLGCVLLEILLRHQLRERAPEESRKEYTQARSSAPWEDETTRQRAQEPASRKHTPRRACDTRSEHAPSPF